MILRRAFFRGRRACRRGRAGADFYVCCADRCCCRASRRPIPTRSCRSPRRSRRPIRPRAPGGYCHHRWLCSTFGEFRKFLETPQGGRTAGPAPRWPIRRSRRSAHPARSSRRAAVESPMRAAGWPPINTVPDPFAIVSGGPTQVTIPPTTAAGMLPIKTVGTPGGRIGPPTCGTGGTAGDCIGQVCMSPARAAGGIFGSSKKSDVLRRDPLISSTKNTRAHTVDRSPSSAENAPTRDTRASGQDRETRPSAPPASSIGRWRS